MGNYRAIQALKERIHWASRDLRKAIDDNDLNEATRQLAIIRRYETALQNEYDKNKRGGEKS